MSRARCRNAPWKSAWSCSGYILQRLQDHFRQAFGRTHHIGGAHRFVGGNQNEVASRRHPAPLAAACRVPKVLLRRPSIDIPLNQPHVFVGRGVVQGFAWRVPCQCSTAHEGVVVGNRPQRGQHLARLHALRVPPDASASHAGSGTGRIRTDRAATAGVPASCRTIWRHSSANRSIRRPRSPSRCDQRPETLPCSRCGNVVATWSTAKQIFQFRHIAA